MTGKREIGDYLDDIYRAITSVEKFVKGMEFDDFQHDEKTIFAVVRAVEVMGEAAKHLPKIFKGKHRSIPWVKITDMRNKMIHEYFGLDLEIVWKTVKENLPELKRNIAKLVKRPNA